MSGIDGSNRLYRSIIRRAIKDLESATVDELHRITGYVHGDQFAFHLKQAGYPSQIRRALRDSLRTAVLLSDVERPLYCAEINDVLDYFDRQKNEPPIAGGS